MLMDNGTSKTAIQLEYIGHIKSLFIPATYEVPALKI